MPFKKGHKKKGGRTKGTPNNNTHEVREFMTLILKENLESLKQDFESLSPSARWNIATKMMNILVPKHEVEFNLSDLSDNQIEELYKRVINEK